MNRPFRFTDRLRSFKFAFHGIALMVKSQPNAWIHLAATITTVTAGIILRLPPPDWCWIVIAITVVWIAEALNTAIEFLCDATTTEFHPLIGKAKDLAAAAVLFAAIGATTIGVIVFLPKILA